MIVLTAYNRPHYLQQTLESWARVRGVQEHELVIAAEPGFEDTLRVASRFDSRLNITVRVNPDRLGVRVNPWHILYTAFNTGAPFVVYSEDDVVVADDVLEMMGWSAACLRDTDARAVLMTQRWWTPGAAEDEHTIRLAPRFAATGWGTWADRWPGLRDLWFTNARGWDWSVQSAIEAGEWLSAVPSFARSQHIGREGTYCTSGIFDEHLCPTFRETYPPTGWAVVD